MVNGPVSNMLPVECGVYQESVLGLFFLFTYVKNMSCILNNVKHCLYADDNVLYLSGEKITDILSNLQSDSIFPCCRR